MILWGQEHKDRAQALAAACHENAADIGSLPRSKDGIAPLACADATLSIWGHGDATHFSEMLDVECGLLISNWKKKNVNLTTVELITCDAQHNVTPLAGYARRVQAFVNDQKAFVKIKALPAGQYADDRSILWANAGTATFCYLTAPSQAAFDRANQRLQALEATKGHDLALTAAELVKERTSTPPGNFTVNGGTFNVLRASLVGI